MLTRIKRAWSTLIDISGNIVLTIDAKIPRLFTLDGSDIVQIDDESVEGNNFVQSEPSNQPDYSNDAINFDGSEYMTAPDNASLRVGSGDFTIAGVLNIDSLNSQRLLMKGREGSSGTGYKRYLLYNNIGKVTIEIDDDTTFKAVSSTNVIKDSRTVVVGMRDGNSLRLFIDGVEDANSPIDITGYGSLDESSPTDLFLGANTEGNFKYSGSLEGLILQKRAWTVKEVEHHYKYEKDKRGL